MTSSQPGDHPSSTATSRARSPLVFFILVFALSLPFSLIDTATGLEVLPGLPVSALVVTFCPLFAALILAYRANRKAGAVELLKRAFDFKRISAKAWYAPVVLLMPGVMVLAYGVMRLLGSPIPAPQFSPLAPLLIFVPLLIAALGEELGWMGYAIDPMQARFGALQAGIVLGVVWSVWHIVPLIQVGRSPEWIAWWFLTSMAHRVIIVWLYNNTGKSVFAAAVYHAMINVTWQLFPINGSYYDPRIVGLIVTCTVVIVTLLWGPKTLARYRFAR